jgi:hypothetical protein
MKTEITGFAPSFAPIEEALRIAWFEYCASCKEQMINIQKQEARKAMIIILSAALCEACINTWLALNLDPDSFALIERVPTVRKWKTAPKFVFEDYHFPTDPKIYGDLKLLFDCRHAIMHAKSEIYAGEEIVHKGNHLLLGQLRRGQIKSLVDITIKLLKHLSQFDSQNAGSIKHASLIYNYVSSNLGLHRFKEISQSDAFAASCNPAA